MNSDCAFYIGSTHESCQDYALATNNRIVISDGCSNSLLSDVGARLLSITALDKILKLNDISKFQPKECILLTRPLTKMLNISNKSLDATLSCAIMDSNNLLQATCLGDGIIAIKVNNGDIFVINIIYEDNYPFYINYLYDSEKRGQNWRKKHNKKKIIFSVIKNDGTVEIINDNCDKPLISIKTTQSSETLILGFLECMLERTNVRVESTEIDFIALMSDGITSFYESITTDTAKYNKNISYTEILKELLNFKNYNGKFVQRRINKFRKNCLKKNWSNRDDVSLAVLYCGE